MKKIYINLLVITFVFLASVVSVHAADLNFTNNTNINIGANTYVVTAGSVATSPMTLSATTLTVTVPAGTFTLQSANGFALSTTGSLPQSCNGNTNSVTITGVAGPIVITPNTASVVCPNGAVSTSSGGGGLASGSSGGGGGFPSPAPTSPTPTVIPGCDNRTSGFSVTSGQSCVGNIVSNTTPPSSPATTPPPTSGQGSSSQGGSAYSTYDFGPVTLKLGSKGNGVRELQRFLNDKLKLGLTLDGVLGPKTIAVIKKWQKAHKLTPDGLIGPKTKKLMNALVVE
jgi:peptidoglycan hydrolase-like protein with peptidoglycan-binding domain